MPALNSHSQFTANAKRQKQIGVMHYFFLTLFLIRYDSVCYLYFCLFVFILKIGALIAMRS